MAKSWKFCGLFPTLLQFSSALYTRFYSGYHVRKFLLPVYLSLKQTLQLTPMVEVENQKKGILWVTFEKGICTLLYKSLLKLFKEQFILLHRPLWPHNGFLLMLQI